MSRIPQPVAYSDGEMTLATALDVRPEQLRMIKRCPDCDAHIIPCDNGVWLDAGKADADVVGAMGIMELAGMMLATSPAGGESGSRHALHRHQPDEEGES